MKHTGKNHATSRKVGKSIFSASVSFFLFHSKLWFHCTVKHTPCLSPLDFWNIEYHSIFFQFQTRKKKSISKQTRFFVEFELDFYCLCSLQKSISNSNWFFNFSNLIFRNWKKIEWHSIFQKSSGDRQGGKTFFKT